MSKQKQFKHVKLNESLIGHMKAAIRSKREEWRAMAREAVKVFTTDATLVGYVRGEFTDYLEDKYANTFGSKGSEREARSVSLKIIRCGHHLPHIMTECAKYKVRSQDQLIRNVCTDVQKVLDKEHKITKAAINKIVKARASKTSKAPKPKHVSERFTDMAALLDSIAEEYDLGTDDNKEVARIAEALRGLSERWSGVKFD